MLHTQMTLNVLIAASVCRRNVADKMAMVICQEHCLPLQSRQACLQVVGSMTVLLAEVLHIWHACDAAVTLCGTHLAFG